jgi:hypothetical protein
VTTLLPVTGLLSETECDFADSLKRSKVDGPTFEMDYGFVCKWSERCVLLVESSSSLS